MNKYEGEKYYTNTNNLKETIKKYGVAIIPNVLSNEECIELVNKMWQYLEHITQNWEIPINRNECNTWKQIYELYPLHSMLIQHHNIGHAQFAWDARQNLKIVEIFANFWKCNSEELLVSFDGSSIHMPPELTNRGWFKGNLWYHSDQSFLRNDFECIQSFVSIFDINEGDSTLTFMEGSNNYHKDAAEEFSLNCKNEWYKINKNIEQFYFKKGCQYQKIKCPRGSMVFWDSRQIHCGVEPLKERPKENMRFVIYLCYMPRSMAKPSALKKKQKAFEELRTTNHCPHHPKLFSKYPRTYGAELKEITIINPPNVSQLGYKLAGF